jgi:hypothetical protein
LRSLAPIMARRSASKSGDKGLSVDKEASVKNGKSLIRRSDLSQLEMDVQCETGVVLSDYQQASSGT